ILDGESLRDRGGGRASGRWFGGLGGITAGGQGRKDAGAENDPFHTGPLMWVQRLIRNARVERFGAVPEVVSGGYTRTDASWRCHARVMPCRLLRFSHFGCLAALHSRARTA